MKTLMAIPLIFAVGLFLTVQAAPDEVAAVPGKLPLFKARNLVDNKEVDLVNLKGHVLIVDFWATWCLPCKKEIPDFIELYQQYKDKQLTILGISVDANQKDVETFIKAQKISYPIMMVSQEVRAAFEKVWGNPMRGIPTTFIFDRGGKLVSVHEGYTQKDVFLKEIKPLLKLESAKDTK
ncbi:TlpA family protein disulfide reductase [Candidatus Poribacteria bacterium]|nr:TlpA family protein disulfide reductase [Candidatus Poribacteria bacterium]